MRSKGVSYEALDFEYLWLVAIERFWPHVHIPAAPGACWLWRGWCMTAQYGEVCWQGGKMGAHRFSYLLHTGPLEPGKVIRHICDRRACVNPRHLLQGTYKDNWEDTRRNKAQLEFEMGKPEHANDAELEAWDEFWEEML